MKALVIGIPGAGKTTVLEKAQKKLPRYNTVNFGTKMLQIGKKEGLAENRDQIRKLPPEKEKELQKKTAKQISKKEDILIDTHLAMETEHGILPGIPRWVINQLKPDKILLIEAEPENIKKRREKDRTRERSDFKLEPKLHQELNRSYATNISTQTGALINIINNKQGKIKETANKIVETMEES